MYSSAFKINLLFALILAIVIPNANCYNLSPKPNMVFSDPQLFTNMPKVESSYFGYSLNLRPQGVIVGAPRGQTNIPTQKNINETGVIYRCPLTTEPCYPYVLDSKPNDFVGDSNPYTYNTEKRDHQWLGAVMDGGTSDADKLIVCAPRFIAPLPNDYFMHGVCYWIPNSLEYQPTNISVISDLRLKRDQLKEFNGLRVYYYMFGEQGFSVHISANNEEFLIGAPGIYTWKGSVVRWHAKAEIDDPNMSRRDLTGHRIARQTTTDLPKIFVGDVLENWDQEDDSLFGYSVASGYFDSSDNTKLSYVATAPQGNSQAGEAYIFDVSGDSIKRLYVLRGSQFGEYFGYSALAVDINGDGLTDVIVSAPQYSISGIYDDGAIYVFINLGRLNFEKKLLTSPVQGRARFGTILSHLGDINHDGYQDIAVSAPFANNGTVFIYLGGERGLRDQPTQHFNSPITTNNNYGEHMFGHGLSKGSDIDSNGFNDFAIGAPNAESIFVYRAYPVVKIRATISSPTREIKPEQNKISVNVCYGISTNSTKITSQNIRLKVVLDAQVRRVNIIGTQSNEQTMEVTAGLTQQCRVLDCEVRYSVADIFKPIELELYYDIVKGIPDSEVFCDDCVAIDPADPKVFSEKIIFSTGCATDICIANLKVQSIGLDHSYILGSSRTLSVKYEISNSGESAYLPQINVTSSNRMPFSRVPSNCNRNEYVMLCDLNKGKPLAKGSADFITVVYDVTNIQGENMILTAEVFSTGKELSYDDNILKDVITLKKFTEIDILGQVLTPQISLENTKTNTANMHNLYEIKSVGPSDIDTLEVEFNIPVSYKFGGSSNKMLPIVDINNISMQAVYDAQIVNIDFYQNQTQLLMGSIEISRTTPLTSTGKLEGPNGFNYDAVKVGHVEEISNHEHSLGDTVLTSSMTRRRRREATVTKEQYARITQYRAHDLLGDDLKGTLPVNRTIVFNCNDAETTSCVRAVMRIPFYKPDKPLTVNLKYIVDLKEINGILTDPWEYFVILIGLDVTRVGAVDDSSLLVNRKIQYNIISKYQTHKTPIWIIIVSVIGGILLLAAICYGLYRWGFFKRSLKDEMNKEMLQSGNVELQNLNSPENNEM